MTEDAERAIREFVKAILHGDDVHRAWLLQASEAFVEGRKIPPPPLRNGKPQEDPAAGIASHHWNFA